MSHRAHSRGPASFGEIRVTRSLTYQLRQIGGLPVPFVTRSGALELIFRPAAPRAGFHHRAFRVSLKVFGLPDQVRRGFSRARRARWQRGLRVPMLAAGVIAHPRCERSAAGPISAVELGRAATPGTRTCVAIGRRQVHPSGACLHVADRGPKSSASAECGSREVRSSRRPHRQRLRHDAAHGAATSMPVHCKGRCRSNVWENRRTPGLIDQNPYARSRIVRQAEV